MACFNFAKVFFIALCFIVFATKKNKILRHYFYKYYKAKYKLSVLKEAFDQTKFGFVQFYEGKIREINNSAREILGIKAEEKLEDKDKKYYEELFKSFNILDSEISIYDYISEYISLSKEKSQKILFAILNKEYYKVNMVNIKIKEYIITVVTFVNFTEYKEMGANVSYSLLNDYLKPFEAKFSNINRVLKDINEFSIDIIIKLFKKAKILYYCVQIIFEFIEIRYRRFCLFDKATNLIRMVEKLKDLFYEEIQKLEVVIEIAQGFPESVYIDRRRLLRVLVSILRIFIESSKEPSEYPISLQIMNNRNLLEITIKNKGKKIDLVPSSLYLTGSFDVQKASLCRIVKVMNGKVTANYNGGNEINLVIPFKESSAVLPYISIEAIKLRRQSEDVFISARSNSLKPSSNNLIKKCSCNKILLADNSDFSLHALKTFVKEYNLFCDSVFSKYIITFCRQQMEKKLLKKS